MFWQYILVFIGACATDIAPLPLPPAVTIMLFLLIMFHLNIWAVIVIGVAGSILGRYILTLYIPSIAGDIFKPSKNADVAFLGKKLKEGGWESHLAILAYALLPLPTTPLFIAAGMANMKPYDIIPAFFVGKFIFDAAAMLLGNYAAENISTVLAELTSWESRLGLGVGTVLLAALLFIDWRTLIHHKQLRLKFKIWK